MDEWIKELLAEEFKANDDYEVILQMLSIISESDSDPKTKAKIKNILEMKYDESSF